MGKLKAKEESHSLQWSGSIIPTCHACPLSFELLSPTLNPGVLCGGHTLPSSMSPGKTHILPGKHRISFSGLGFKAYPCLLFTT